jgi:hypothetical protein
LIFGDRGLNGREFGDLEPRGHWVVRTGFGRQHCLTLVAMGRDEGDEFFDPLGRQQLFQVYDPVKG